MYRSDVVEPGTRDRCVIKLSRREIECLQWLAKGLRNDQIANKLEIKPVTVELHIINARKKLSAKTREQALVKAVRLGLI